MGAGAETVILSLSQSNQFIVIRSIPTASYNDQAGVVDTRQGFIFHSPHHTGLLYRALLLHLPLRRLTLHFELCLTDVSPPVAAEGAQPVATIAPSVLNVQQGQRAEFRCTVTGNPTPAIEWIGMTGVSVSCCIISSAEQSCVKFTSWYTKIPPLQEVQGTEWVPELWYEAAYWPSQQWTQLMREITPAKPWTLMGSTQRGFLSLSKVRLVFMRAWKYIARCEHVNTPSLRGPPSLVGTPFPNDCPPQCKWFCVMVYGLGSVLELEWSGCG